MENNQNNFSNWSLSKNKNKLRERNFSEDNMRNQNFTLLSFNAMHFKDGE